MSGPVDEARRSGVTDFLLADSESENIALWFENRDVTYGELGRAVTQVAGYLSSIGCQAGDRVLLVGDNSFFWIAAYLGIMHAGLVCVPLPPGLTLEDFTRIAGITAATAAFMERRTLSRFSRGLGGVHVVVDRGVEPSPPHPQSTFEQLLQAPPRVPIRPRREAADLAAIMFTSGSTRTPRGVMISHGNIIANTDSIIQSLQLTRHDRIMAVLPFHYCFGTSLLHTHLRVGGGLVVDSRFMYPEVVLDRMEERACTGFAGVPSHFNILLHKSTIRRRRLPTLRYVQQAGGALHPMAIDELRSALPATQIFVMYGQTEATARLSCLPPALLDEKRGSIGKGIPGVVVRVLSERGEAVRPGEVGEIVASGENIAAGYWRDPDESAAIFRNGSLFTGDLATIDEDGFVYIVGRARDFLKCRGERIACHSLEAELLECEEVLEVAVVGVPDPILGEAVRAFVVPKAGASQGLEERVRAFCLRRMPAHLVPKEIVVMPALPKTHEGKVAKRELLKS